MAFTPPAKSLLLDLASGVTAIHLYTYLAISDWKIIWLLNLRIAESSNTP